jgi:2,3-bisphosphoglycerate-independent phosphoglycerate mutase
LPVEVAFPPEESYSLAHAVSDAGWRQFHVAETEKYAHVTYFFNGGREAPLPGEERRLVPSPKVATYDLQPAMNAPGVTDALIDAIQSDEYDLIVANFANADMVGHTGVWDSTVSAVETIDACLGRIVTALDARDALALDAPGALLAITADHGNADQMRDAAGNPVTAHSLNPVPLLLAGRAEPGCRGRSAATRRSIEAGAASRSGCGSSRSSCSASSSCSRSARTSSRTSDRRRSLRPPERSDPRVPPE